MTPKAAMTPTDLNRKAEELAGPHSAMCKKGETCQCSHRERLALIRATLWEMQEEIERLEQSYKIAHVAALYVKGEAEKQHERAEAAEEKCAELEAQALAAPVDPKAWWELSDKVAQAEARGRAAGIKAAISSCERAGSMREAIQLLRDLAPDSTPEAK